MYHGLQHAVTVTILAQGTSWAVAITQAFFFRWFKPLLATSWAVVQLETEATPNTNSARVSLKNYDRGVFQGTLKNPSVVFAQKQLKNKWPWVFKVFWETCANNREQLRFLLLSLLPAMWKPGSAISPAM
jgi:hypothetical protein